MRKGSEEPLKAPILTKSAAVITAVLKLFLEVPRYFFLKKNNNQKWLFNKLKNLTGLLHS